MGGLGDGRPGAEGVTARRRHLIEARCPADARAGVDAERCRCRQVLPYAAGSTSRGVAHRRCSRRWLPRFSFIRGYTTGIMILVEHNEIFPNAPIALTVVEVRYPHVSDTKLGMPIQRRIRDALGSEWVIHNGREQTFEAGMGVQGPHAALHTEAVHRITSRRRTKLITVRVDRLSVEVADYTGYADFRDLVHRVASAVEDVVHPDGIERIGIRYIDEISVGETQPNWQEWIAGSLMPPILPTSLIPDNWKGTVQYPFAEDRTLIFNYGTFDKPVVAPDGPLKRPRVPRGPLFVLDFDSSWQPADIPEFDAELITAETDALRAPIRGLFDDVLLPTAIETFRKEPTA